ncbi:PTS sugar transporter subunit IIA [Suicoccus acidiformans]|nr:PTS sugar transporter subunit IIA [Suicoccus acidiformans]
MEQISTKLIALNQDAKNWEDALIIAGNILEVNGYITADYTHEMINAVHDLGPYIVIAPGIAFGHARPSNSVKRTGFSIVTLNKPVEFGNKENDPVSIIMALSAINSEDHLNTLQRLIEFLQVEKNISYLKQAKTEQDKETIIRLINNGGDKDA